jgi:ABC-type Fe3+/spermidine/putrescine transport system ATPase subunit
MLPQGAAATLALRPERLQLCRERPPGFAVAATVSSISYLGGASTVHLTAGEGRVLKARLPSADAGCLVRGMAVWAHWSPDDGVVIAR